MFLIYATTIGLGPFRPVIMYNNEHYLYPMEFASETEALSIAQSFIDRLQSRTNEMFDVYNFRLENKAKVEHQYQRKEEVRSLPLAKFSESGGVKEKTASKGRGPEEDPRFRRIQRIRSSIQREERRRLSSVRKHDGSECPPDEEA